jgi:sigma-B regulation protein RsbU (phosphoserine phosphatase)
MALNDNIKTVVRKSRGTGLLLVFVAAAMLEATTLIQYLSSQRMLKREASQRAESELRATRNQIMDVVDQAEAAVHNSIWIARWCLDYPDSLVVVSRRIVEENPSVMGSTFALVPGYNKNHPLFSPYVCRSADGNIEIKSLATEDYDYPSQEWFTEPLNYGIGYWSEPYVDTGGGNVLMTTYSVPVTDESGRIAAVLTADVSLDWLTDLIGSVRVYPNAFSVLISRDGTIMVSPVEEFNMQRSIQDYAKGARDTANFNILASAMLTGKSGNLVLGQRRRERTSVFYGPVEKTGWSMAIVIPDSEIYGEIRRMGVLVGILMLVGLSMLILILTATAKSQLKYAEVNEKKERMEHELSIGHNIQMSMIPKTFPPFPERKDIDMAATIVPAKAVGGDLYDFFIRDEKLYFCIGDVSGKGVPASLLMSVTRTLFRSVASHEKSPQRIVTLINNAMSDMNENDMFVTFFCGILDMATGHLRYCNAGHNPPLIFTDEVGMLPVLPNLPLGVMGGVHFPEQELDLACDNALFLYTDGVTEAENTSHEQFGEDRMIAVLRERRDSQGHLKAMEKAVADFVGSAEQSDDLTMLFIHYLNDMKPDATERHLILHNNIQQIPQLADFIETIANEMRLDQSLAMSLNLALEEAVTNVILYAYPAGSDGLVDIEAIMGKDILEFIISDSGVAFDPTAAPEADISLGVEDRPIGGLGIFLVRNIMDTVSYQRTDGKNILSMTKKL